jgi:ubiquitin carboxyl-terminal hydrolase 7
MPSPNEMVMDTDDYVGVGNDPEKDPIAIITPDEPESEPPLDEPLATDRKSAILSAVQTRAA